MQLNQIELAVVSIRDSTFLEDFISSYRYFTSSDISSYRYFTSSDMCTTCVHHNYTRISDGPVETPDHCPISS